MKKVLITAVICLLFTGNAFAQKHQNRPIDCETDVLYDDDCPSWCDGVVSSVQPSISPSGEAETVIVLEVLLNPSQGRECTMIYPTTKLQAGQAVAVLTTKKSWKHGKSTVRIESK